MLYEPDKTKKYLIIFGISAVFLAILIIVAVPLFYRQKTPQTPSANLPLTAEQKRIQKEMKEVAEKLKNQKVSGQKIGEDMNSASEEVQKLPIPSEEEMKRISEDLNQ